MDLSWEDGQVVVSSQDPSTGETRSEIKATTVDKGDFGVNALYLLDALSLELTAHGRKAP